MIPPPPDRVRGIPADLSDLPETNDAHGLADLAALLVVRQTEHRPDWSGFSRLSGTVERFGADHNLAAVSLAGVTMTDSAFTFAEFAARLGFALGITREHAARRVEPVEPPARELLRGSGCTPDHGNLLDWQRLQTAAEELAATPPDPQARHAYNLRLLQELEEQRPGTAVRDGAPC